MIYAIAEYYSVQKILFANLSVSCYRHSFSYVYVSMLHAQLFSTS